MDFDTIGFLAISGLLVLTAILTIESRKLVHYILFLFMFLVAVAAMFLYLNAVFLGIAELIIYNGGIVLLLAVGMSLMPEGSINPVDLKYVIVIPIVVLGILSFLLLSYSPLGVSTGLDYTNFSTQFFQSYSIVLAVLGLTAVASLLATIYFINKEDIA